MKNNINRQLRNKAQKAVQNAVNATYYSEVPIDTIADNLRTVGIVMIQEDNTEWSGMLCGSDSRCTIRIARNDVYDITRWGTKKYEEIDNACIALTWYKCTSRKDSKFEVIAYLA